MYANLISHFEKLNISLNHSNTYAIANESVFSKSYVLKAPLLDTEQMLLRRTEDLSQEKAPLDPTDLYLDAEDAASYLRLLKSSPFLGDVDPQSLAFAADMILTQIHEHAFNPNQLMMLGLGIGDGQKETHLINQLLQRYPFEVMSYFFDINCELVQHAHEQAQRALAHHRNVYLFPIWGNFYHLPVLKNLFYSSEESLLRVACLFGGTFGQLPDETHFIKHVLSILKKNEIVLIDVDCAVAEPLDSKTIVEKDAFFAFVEEQTAYTSWISEFMKRHLSGKRSSIMASIHPQSGTIPSGYTISLSEKQEDGNVRNLLSLKRYSLPALKQVFSTHGFDLLGEVAYGFHPHRKLCIFQRKSDPKDAWESDHYN